MLHESEFVDERTIDGFSDDFFSGIISLTLNAANEFFGEGSEKTNSEPELYSIKFSSREILVRYNFFSTQENFDFSNYYLAIDLSKKFFLFYKIQKNILKFLR